MTIKRTLNAIAFCLWLGFLLAMIAIPPALLILGIGRALSCQ